MAVVNRGSCRCPVAGGMDPLTSLIGLLKCSVEMLGTDPTPRRRVSGAQIARCEGLKMRRDLLDQWDDRAGCVSIGVALGSV